jgi:iron complex transport system substrate-binding protein
MTYDIKTRSLVLAAGFAMASGLLAACGGSEDGGDDTAESGSAEGGTRTVEHALGDVTIPAEPTRIVALDELSALSALAAGSEPMVVFASLGDTVAADILRDAGLDVREAEILSLPSREALLALEPDLIVGLQHEELSAVAPTAVLGIEGEWRDITVDAAAIFAAEDAGERQVAAIEAQLAAADAATEDGDTLAMIGFTTETFTMPPHSPSSTLIAEAGFTRPESEQVENDSYSAPFSMELLLEHDADIIVIPDGPGAAAAEITGQELFNELTGTTVHPVAQQWWGNSAFSFWVTATDLRTLAEGGTDVLRSEDLVSEWSTFLHTAAGS